MYRLQVLYYGEWEWGVRDYDTLDSAKARLEKLKKAGIKARVRLTAELFN